MCLETEKLNFVIRHCVNDKITNSSKWSICSFCGADSLKNFHGNLPSYNNLLDAMVIPAQQAEVKKEYYVLRYMECYITDSQNCCGRLMNIPIELLIPPYLYNILLYITRVLLIHFICAHGMLHIFSKDSTRIILNRKEIRLTRVTFFIAPKTHASFRCALWPFHFIYFQYEIKYILMKIKKNGRNRSIWTQSHSFLFTPWSTFVRISSSSCRHHERN